MTLSNVAFASRYNSNLISLGQLRMKAGISEHNHSESMIFKKTRNIISSIKQKKNLFVLDLQENVDMIMIAQGRGKLIYLLSKNPKVRLWYYHFAHVSNAQIILVSKLVDRIKLSNAAINNPNNNCFSSNSQQMMEKEDSQIQILQYHSTKL